MVRVWDRDFNLLRTIVPFPDWKGGVYVACGDLGGLPGDEIVTAPGRGGSPHVRVFDGGGKAIRQWNAHRSTWSGGIFVASGDACPETGDEVVTGPDRPGSPHIRVFHADGSICEGYLPGVTTYPKSGIRAAVGSFQLMGHGVE